MKNRWSDEYADQFLTQYAARWGADLAVRTYTTRLLGSESALVLHGGGNTSLKGTYRNVFGQDIPTLFMKASGFNLGTIEPEGHTPMDLEYLRRMCAIPTLSDDAMAGEFLTHRLVPNAASPSIETLSHAYIPAKYIDHTHADAVLVLTNQPEGDKLIREALGEGVALVDYIKPGFKLAKAVMAAYDANPGCHALVWLQHGIMTWGETAREAYSAMIDLVTRAEEFAARRASKPLVVVMPTSLAEAQNRLAAVAPVVRGLLAQPSGNADRPYRRMILQPVVTQEILDFLGSDRGKELALTPTLTSDHLVRTKALPLWIESPDYNDLAKLREQLVKGITAFGQDYQAYLARNAALMPPGMKPFDSLPRIVLLPGLGALCAGKDAHAARIAHDITVQTLAAKARIAAMGTYRGLAEDHLFEVEYFTLQHAKLKTDEPPLGREVAIVTGAAGAIGSAIADGLLANGCHVALTDLAGSALENLGEELKKEYGERVMTTPLDVTDPASVSQGFDAVIKTVGRRRSGHHQRRPGHGLFAGTDGPGQIPAHRTREHRRNFTAPSRSRAPFPHTGNGWRHCSGLHQERLHAGRKIRGLQRHQGGRAPIGSHRQPGNGRNRCARQHGRSGRRVFTWQPPFRAVGGGWPGPHARSRPR